jgi:hypothetical protein
MSTKYSSVIAATIGALVFASCSATDRSPEAIPFTTVLEVVEEPSDPVEQLADSVFTYCGLTGPGIYANGEISDLEPNDRDDYCDGYRDVYNDSDSLDVQNVCSEFWFVADTVILDFLLTENVSRDYGIGMVDAFWSVC